MVGATDTYLPLWGKEEKHMLETNLNRHTSGFSLFNCNNTVHWLIMWFRTTLKTLLSPARHTAWVVGSEV